MNSIEWQGATPEQYNLWDKVIPLLVGVQTITPLFFIGAVAASEFLTYDVKKLYIALELSSGQYTLAAAVNIIALFNEANVQSYTTCNLVPAWDTTAALMKYANNEILLKNVYFSRLTCGQYIRFNGYRITIP
jgi:hypothetical protein